MLVVLIVSLIASLICLWGARGNNKNGLEIAFIVIGIVSAIRYDFGNDYWGYYSYFSSVSESSLANIFLTREKEWLFYVFMWLFKDIGYQSFVAVNSAIVLFAYYKLIKKYIPAENQWIGFAIYVFSPMLFVLQLSMMRQALAIALCIFSFLSSQNKKYFWSITLIVAAYFVHTTSIVMAPYIILSLFNIRNPKSISIVYLVVVLFLILNYSVTYNLLTYLSAQSESFSNSYEHYSAASGYGNAIQYGIGTVLTLFFLGIVWWAIFKCKLEGSNISIALIALGDIILLPFEQFIPMISRASTYYTSFMILAVPLIFPKVITDKRIRTFVVILFFSLAFYKYAEFFSSSSVYFEEYKEFHTIFSVPKSI